MVICNHHQGCGETDCYHATPHELCEDRETCYDPCSGYCDLVVFEVECIDAKFYEEAGDQMIKFISKETLPQIKPTFHITVNGSAVMRLENTVTGEWADVAGINPYGELVLLSIDPAWANEAGVVINDDCFIRVAEG